MWQTWDLLAFHAFQLHSTVRPLLEARTRKHFPCSLAARASDELYVLLIRCTHARLELRVDLGVEEGASPPEAGGCLMWQEQWLLAGTSWSGLGS